MPMSFVVFLYTTPYKKDTKRRGKIVGVCVSTALCKTSIWHAWGFRDFATHTRKIKRKQKRLTILVRHVTF